MTEPREQLTEAIRTAVADGSWKVVGGSFREVRSLGGPTVRVSIQYGDPSSRALILTLLPFGTGGNPSADVLLTVSPSPFFVDSVRYCVGIERALEVLADPVSAFPAGPPLTD